MTALRQALDEDPTLERLREVAIRKLEEGDLQFWRMLLDRIWPTKLELTNEMREPLVVRWQSPLDLGSRTEGLKAAPLPLIGDRTFKLGYGTTSEYGRYVKSLWGAPWRAPCRRPAL